MDGKKTLIIGLGGIGGQILSRVYDEIPVEARKNVVVHAFDTDVNQISKLGFTKDDYTQTSSDMTVEQYLAKDNMRDSVKSWFVTEHPSIMKMSFINGAGQIRAISRLAYMASIGEGRLKSLEKKLKDLFVADGEIYDSEVRIMIVSSMVGGTGSGIFLQTALYLKDYFETLGKTVRIRGSFLLPDIFVKNGIISGSQTKNIQANGYACLKELDAIMGSTGGVGDSKATIQLAYKPDMKDRDITKNPYDFAFLYDYENTDGKNLGNFDQYLSQVSKAVYLQLFSAISGKADSDEINMIINLVAANGKARYGSAGVSTIVYPYEDILKYTAYRLSNDKIGTKWLKLDKLFEFLKEKEIVDQKNGIFQEPLKKYEKLNELFDAEVKNEDIFFKLINRTLHLIIKDEELGPKKSDVFLSNVEKKIKKEIEESKEYAEYNSDKAPNEENLGPKGNMVSEVEEFELKLSRYKKAINNSIQMKKNILVNAIVPTLIQEESDSYKFDYQLGYWIVGRNNEALNPLATRYFLNDIKIKLTEDYKKLVKELTDLSSGIEKYEFDFADTNDGGKSARERVDEVVNKKGFLGLGEHKDVKLFREEYEDKAKKQFKRLENYRDSKITQGVLEELLKIVDDLLENDIEVFFRSLGEIINEFTKEAIVISKEHEEKKDVTKLYILATSEAKEKLYNEVQKKVDADNVLNGMYKDIYIEQYSRLLKRKKGENLRDLPNIKDLYKEKILNSYIDKIRTSDILDKDIITAIREEFDMQRDLGKTNSDDVKNYTKDLFLSASSIAKPLALKKGADDLSIWGINPIILDKINDNEKSYLFNTDPIIDNEGFKKYEIIRYTSTYGLKAQDFDKFSSGDIKINKAPGTYFTTYMEIVKKLKEKESLTITPHLDRNWHLQAYMPDLNSAQADADKESINKVFLYGLLYEYIKQIRDDGTTAWNSISKTGFSSKVKKQGQIIKGRYSDLYEVLEFNPAIVDEIMSRVEEQRELDCDEKYRTEILKHKFIDFVKESKNFIDILIRYKEEIGDRDSEKTENTISELMDFYIRETEKYISDFYGSNKVRTGKKVLMYFLIATLNNSEEIKGADEGIPFIENFNNKIRVKVENLLKEIDIDERWNDIKNSDYKVLVEIIQNK